MAKCNPQCLKTASLDEGGHRIMVSQSGNKKYPIAHTPHPQCLDCAAEECKKMLDEIAEFDLFGGDQTLIEKYRKLKKL